RYLGRTGVLDDVTEEENDAVSALNGSRPAFTQRRDRVDLLFFDFDDNPNCAKNLSRKIDVVSCGATAAGNSGRRPTNCRRRIGQRAHESRVSGFFHGRNPNASCERDDEFISKVNLQFTEIW